METVKVNLYALNELSESAKKNAFDHFRDEFLEVENRILWTDVENTLYRLQEMTQCTFDISSSSQGFACVVRDEKYNTLPLYDESNEDRRFERLLRKIKLMDVRTWADDILKKQAEIHRWHSYPYASEFCYNLSNIVCHFCRDAENDIYNSCDSDDLLENYITVSLGIGCQFTENGKFVELA